MGIRSEGNQKEAKVSQFWWSPIYCETHLVSDEKAAHSQLANGPSHSLRLKVGQEPCSHSLPQVCPWVSKWDVMGQPGPVCQG